MKTLTLRIYLTVVAVLLLFAAVSGWLFQRHMDDERVRAESMVSERMAAWGDLIQRSLPGPDAPDAEQAAALNDWSQRLRMPMALADEKGRRIAESELFTRFEAAPTARSFALKLDDGRTLLVVRPGRRRAMQSDAGGAQPWAGDRGRRDAQGQGGRRGPPPDDFDFLPRGIGWLVLLVVLFFAVAGAAWPVARALTRRLAALKLGVERFGSGHLSHRVEVSGRDEVAAVASSFNQAAARIEALVHSHQSLLANASHELRSPLARMKMAIEMLDDASAEQRYALKFEIDTNIAELDALVEEVLLASRLDASADLATHGPVDLLLIAQEEAGRMNAPVEGDATVVIGDDRLLRRALRNLLENAKRYGGDQILVKLVRTAGQVEVQVCDRGPGVPEASRERIFEAFYRLPGHAEQAGGVGLGLSLVRQIAERHGGSVRCVSRDGGGSCFVMALPLSKH
ncbi:MAG: HAMP domain-containing sensor histidine kinase [Ideonella sp.]